MDIRDPIHGTISLLPGELEVLDHPAVQRLRRISQLGFCALPFPGATHTRYLHALGAMHLGGKACELALASARQRGLLTGSQVALWTRVVRLAALLHDIGHPPYSHAAECALPRRRALWPRRYAQGDSAGDVRASHEELTAALILRTDLAETLSASGDFSAEVVASLLDRSAPDPGDFFQAAGIDWRPALRQLVSSELDVDRLDYLVRDAWFAGVGYGRVDQDWLTQHLDTHEVEGRRWLALHPRALYAFDDYLLSRYHMFVMVYFHHKSVVCEEMLRRWVEESSPPLELPADLSLYLRTHDATLWEQMERDQQSPWSRDLSAGRLWRRVLETHSSREDDRIPEAEARLEQAGIPCMRVHSRGKISRYQHSQPGSECLYVSGDGQPAQTLHSATEVFQRYAGVRHLQRLYVPPEARQEAEALLKGSSAL